jgi:hypothetical protein
MVTKFSQQFKKNTVYCIVDNTDKCHSGWAREINVNLSDFMINRIIANEHDVLIGADEKELLITAYNEGYTHAVMIASGTSFKLSERIFKHVDNLCKKDFFIAGHIIDREDNYYEIHHQFYVVFLPEYYELDFPNIGEEEKITHTQIEPLRAVEGVFGDHDLPLWVKPGIEHRSYIGRKHGYNLFSQAMIHNRNVIDLGDSIRLDKKYLYYEYDYVFLREMSEIYHNQFFCNNVFFPFNTDILPEIPQINKKIEQYISVGTGLNWIYNLNKFGYTDDATVVFTDINYQCLQFMESLVNEWDGTDYVSFFKSKQTAIVNGRDYDINLYLESWNNQFIEFTKNFDDFISVWNRIRQLKFKYILVDYTSKYDLNWIERDKNTLINLSDLFNHVPYVALQSLKYRISCENRLITSLQKIVPDSVLVLTSRASDGFTDRKKRIDYVKNFEITDINTLNKPPWHLHDWDRV